MNSQVLRDEGKVNSEFKMPAALYCRRQIRMLPPLVGRPEADDNSTRSPLGQRILHTFPSLPVRPLVRVFTWLRSDKILSILPSSPRGGVPELGKITDL